MAGTYKSWVMSYAWTLVKAGWSWSKALKYAWRLANKAAKKKRRG